METTPHVFQDRTRDIQERVGPQIDQARAALADWNQRAVSFIRERPGTCLIGALAFGYVVGKIVSRR
jgi:hypothetical protein